MGGEFVGAARHPLQGLDVENGKSCTCVEAWFFPPHN